MTTATNKIISEVYGVPTDSYNFQIMYMPLDTGIFTNDAYTIVVMSLLPIIFLAISRLPEVTLEKTGHIEFEKEIQSILQRLGMRKSAEMAVSFILLCIYIVFTCPLLVWVVTGPIMAHSVSYGYFFIVVLIFFANNLTMKHALRFLLPEKPARIAFIIL